MVLLSSGDIIILVTVSSLGGGISFMLEIFMLLSWVLGSFVSCRGFCIVGGGFISAIRFVLLFVFSSSMDYCMA